MPTRSSFCFLLLAGLMSAVAHGGESGGAYMHHETWAAAIRVSASAIVTAPPDQAEFQVGALTTAKSAQQALTENNAIIAAIQTALSRHSVDERNRQTVQFDISPEFKQRSDAGSPPEVVAYRVQHILNVTVLDLEKLGRVLDDVVSAGSNVLYAIRFSIADPQPLYSQARSQAVRNARSKAEELAAASGVRLGKLRSLGEHGANGITPMMAQGVAEMRMSSVQVSPGEQKIRVDVSAEYAIEP